MNACGGPPSSATIRKLAPRLQLAGKAALAAGVAWQLALLFPSPIDQYAYYAPLGAVLALYPTVASSLRAAWQTVLGILLGATISLAVDSVLSPNAWTVALVIASSILVGALRWLGDQRSWVPITALFIFVIGSTGSRSYFAGYVVLTLLGAAVGTLANVLVFPPLHLRASRRALDALRELVVSQLEDLAGGLEANEQPDPDAWKRRTQAISPAVSTMRDALADMDRSLRINPRAGRYRQATDAQQNEARALYRMAVLVEDLVQLFAEVEQEDIPALPFNQRTRQDCARTMRTLAALTANSSNEGFGDKEVSTACSTLDDLQTSLTDDLRSGGADPFVAGSIIMVLRRCLGAMASCGGPTAIATSRERLLR